MMDMAWLRPAAAVVQFDAFDGDGETKDRCGERTSKMLLDHGEEAGGLFGKIVRIDRGFLDHGVDPILG
jgi:hypothetical protein